jgi:ubiquinone/menaquinone biosynthesis C-methylase UbiE
MKDISMSLSAEFDPFGLRRIDFRVRIPEKTEIFSPEEARAYIDGCDYPESIDDLLLALEIEHLFGSKTLKQMNIMDAMCGPGRLGRELLILGAHSVTFHDGDPIMLAHAKTQAHSLNGRVGFQLSPVDAIGLPDNTFDLVVCHNSTHQLSDEAKLATVMKEFVRIIKPGGHIVIADFQRETTPEFIDALDERLKWTKNTIVPLLIPTFLAAFSKNEFSEAIGKVPGLPQWSVLDAKAPSWLTPAMLKQVNADPVKGHILDFSPISLRVIAQKEML